MPSMTARELVGWFDQAIALCEQWEEWAAQQFAALAQGDLNALMAINAQQVRLADRLSRLEIHWRQIQGALAVGEPARSPSWLVGDPGALDDLVARRRKLLTLAERVFAANYRNIKAFTLLDALGTSCAPLVVGQPGQLYDRHGSSGAQRAALRRTLDREG